MSSEMKRQIEGTAW